MKPILMFSGGVDSAACLHMMREQEPILFFVQTLKTQWHANKIRKLAKKLSPNSPFYTFYTNTKDYEATIDVTNPLERIYGIDLWGYGDRPSQFYPLAHNHPVAVGYFKHRGNTKRPDKKGRYIIPEGQDAALSKLDLYRSDVLLLPLKDMHAAEIEHYVEQFPNDIQELITSSTRSYYPRFVA